GIVLLHVVRLRGEEAALVGGDEALPAHVELPLRLLARPADGDLLVPRAVEDRAPLLLGELLPGLLPVDPVAVADRLDDVRAPREAVLEVPDDHGPLVDRLRGVGDELLRVDVEARPEAV